MKSIFICLVILILAVGCKTFDTHRAYEVTIPEQWQSSISVGKLTIVGSAFYGVPWSYGLYPVVRLNLTVENLTSDTLYLKFNYRTESKKKGFSNSGMGVCYTLHPHEKRPIDTIAPIASVTRPIRFMIRMGEPLRNFDIKASAATKVVIIDPFEVSKTAAQDIELQKVENDDFEIKEVQLTYSREQGNLVVFKVKNRTNQDLSLGAYVAVNDPGNIETKGGLGRQHGFFSDSTETIPANKVTIISIPYNIPPVGPNPVLVFTLFKPYEDNDILGKRDRRRWDVRLVGYGSFNLGQAAERGVCVIPVYPPVEERAKLAVQKNQSAFYSGIGRVLMLSST